MDRLIVPDEATKYILFQRTKYLRFLNASSYSQLGNIFPLIHKQLVYMEARIYASRIKALYENDMEKEYQSIKEFLPKECTVILDIGCGVAGIDVFLNNHYKDSNQVEFYLLDKTEIEKRVFYNFKPRASFYNSLNIAKTMLVGNGISDKCVHLLEVDNANGINITGNIDLVVSLISWGFHYPIETYLDKVYNLLSKKGCLITDVRKGTNGLITLKNIFNKLDIILDEKKFQRVLVTK